MAGRSPRHWPGIARETTLLFPLALALAALFGLADGTGKRTGRSVRSAVVLILVSVLPYLLLRLVILAWIGREGATP